VILKADIRPDVVQRATGTRVNTTHSGNMLMRMVEIGAGCALHRRDESATRQAAQLGEL